MSERPPELGPGRPIARYLSIGVGVLLIGLVGLLAFAGPADEEDEGTSLLGGRTPRVQGTTLTGERYDIDDRRGRWVIVNFFATWCAPCVNEHPELVELERLGQERGDVEIVAVIFNDPVDRVEEFFAERGGGWPVLDDPTIPVEFQVAQIPETFVVSPTGRVVAQIEGEVRAAEVVQLIEGA